MIHSFWILAFSLCLEDPSTDDQLSWATARVVKLYGAGGVGRLEGYGSGVFVAGSGLILTVDSPLLSAESIRVVLSDGSRRTARLAGVDRTIALAALQIDGDRPTAPYPHFDVTLAPPGREGDSVWAVSNLFGIAVGNEAVSVQKGIISAHTSWATRQGTEAVPFSGKLFVLDIVTNNPGAAGGALINSEGQLVGIIGKEIRHEPTRMWINTAFPMEQILPFIERVNAGTADKTRPLSTEPVVDRRELARVDLRGVRLLPEVLDRTPPFVDGVETDSPAQWAGLVPDDLIVYVQDIIIPSTTELRLALLEQPTAEPIRLMILRNNELLPIILPPRHEPTEELKTP
ncbi:S1C family serine protease [bacterium]|nr:S1C family serine protease [bacterium]